MNYRKNSQLELKKDYVERYLFKLSQAQKDNFPLIEELHSSIQNLTTQVLAMTLLSNDQEEVIDVTSVAIDFFTERLLFNHEESQKGRPMTPAEKAGFKQADHKYRSKLRSTLGKTLAEIEESLCD